MLKSIKFVPEDPALHPLPIWLFGRLLLVATVLHHLRSMGVAVKDDGPVRLSFRTGHTKRVLESTSRLHAMVVIIHVSAS